MKHTLFIQKRASRAGAQTSLARLVTSDAVKQLNPLVLLSEEGWLSNYLKEHSIPSAINPWPSSRSLLGRIGGVSFFAKKIAHELRSRGLKLGMIVANDHQECILANRLSFYLGQIPVAAILRTPGMSGADFVKYECVKSSALFAVGHELQNKSQNWFQKEVLLYEEGFYDQEFLPPKTSSSQFPAKILCIGSSIPRKGFIDFIEAIELFEKLEPSFKGMNCVLTGDPIEIPNRDSIKSKFEFVGRIDNLIDFARGFDLAIHPSRHESFGLAPLELIIAGIPTLVSRTGVIESLGISDKWCFEPNNPLAIAQALRALFLKWDISANEISANEINLQQETIRKKHNLNTTSKKFANKILEFCKK